MRKFRFGIQMAALLMLVGQLFLIDYSNLGSDRNMGTFLSICALLLVFLAMLISNRQEKALNG